MRWAVFVSGTGSNLQNFLDLERKRILKKHRIVLVVADRPCPAIDKAKRAKKEVWIQSPKSEGFSKALLKALKAQRVDAIFLLGYMRILSEDFLKSWKKRIVNLHPSWLPQYPGLNAIERAVQADEDFLGVTLHEVVPEVDAGPILRQISFPRDRSLSLESLTEQVHAYERKLVTEFLLDLERLSS